MPHPFHPSPTGSFDDFNKARAEPEIVLPTDREQQMAWLSLVERHAPDADTTALRLLVLLRRGHSEFLTLNPDQVAYLSRVRADFERDLDKLKLLGLLDVHFQYLKPARVALIFGQSIRLDHARA